MQANFDLGGNRIVNLADPAEPQDAATKGYVDSQGVTFADLGEVEGFSRKGEEYQLYAFQLADGVYKRKEGIISSDGSTSMRANFDLGGNRIVNLADPAEPQEAKTKGYVDSRIRVRQEFNRIYGYYARDKSTSFGPSGHKRTKLFMAIMPPGKSIYNGKIVLDWHSSFTGKWHEESS